MLQAETVAKEAVAAAHHLQQCLKCIQISAE
jgi:hypothetical protein